MTTMTIMTMVQKKPNQRNYLVAVQHLWTVILNIPDKLVGRCHPHTFRLVRTEELNRWPRSVVAFSHRPKSLPQYLLDDFLMAVKEKPGPTRVYPFRLCTEDVQSTRLSILHLLSDSDWSRLNPIRSECDDLPLEEWCQSERVGRHRRSIHIPLVRQSHWNSLYF